MGISPGTRLGPYEILSAIGAGGMGEVYRARDTRLNRDVAIKVLPEVFAADAERVARFQREAEVLAALNHPHIAHIYGFEDGRALVLELVEGPTLADRIAAGPIPLEDALPIARQIADALEAAHERGIVHRDLKPANIKLATDGNVKVLDFGLAKLSQASDSVLRTSDPTNSPTITSPAMATHAGVILGTAAYMSPEQAKGKPVDRRTDMWAFGCVLYEMLTGKRAFEGADVTETLAEILKGEPDLRAMPAATPAPVVRLLRRCLAKDARARLADAGAARLELDEAASPSTSLEPRPSARASKHARVAWAVAALSVIAAVGAIAVPRFLATPPIEPVTARFTVSLPARTTVIGAPFIPAVSPDGRHIAFNSYPGGPYLGAEIWVRSLDMPQPRPIPGLDRGAYSPFWSPDATRLGFFLGDDVKAIPIAGGVAETICESCGGFGGSWGPDGTILIGTRKGIIHLPAVGGEPRLVTRAKEGTQRAFHVWPQFLPGGRRFIYFSSPDNAVHVASLDSTETRQLLKTDAQAEYVAPGHLLFTRQGTLYAQPFDHTRAEFLGSAVQIASEIALLPNYPHASFSASNNGILVYRSLEGVARPASKLVWLNRQGHALGEVAGRFDDRIIDLSPTSAYAVIDRFSSSIALLRDLWLIDLRRGTSTRMTSDSSDECCPIWSPDGKRIIFNSDREGVRNLYEIEPDSMDPPRLVLKTSAPKYPKDWSPDGRSIVFETVGDNTGRDLWMLPLIGERVPVPIIQTAADESSGRFSPDGRWIAYVSNQSGRYEVYVQSLIDPGRGRLQVSTEGGFFPRWRADGREIFYVAPNRKLMVVAVEPKMQQLELGVPQQLFDLPISDPAAQQFTDKYDVTPDGQRFLVLQIIDEQVSVDLTVVMNWSALLRK